MIIEGYIHVLGDDVDTDVIIPGRYLMITEPSEVAKHIFEGVEPDFIKRVRPGDIIVAGKNFGCGSSREQAPVGLKALGISAIIAKSFARIFFRNAVNIGLPIFIAPQVVDYVNSLLETANVIGSFIKTTDVKARIDVNTGIIYIGGKQFMTTPIPKFIREIMRSGSLIEWAKERLRSKQIL